MPVLCAASTRMVKRRSIIQPYSATTPVDEVTQIGSSVTFLVTQADHPNDILRRVRVNDTGGEFSELVADTGTAATTYTDDTVEDSTHYTYRIKAINEYGGERALRQVVLRRVLPELEVQRRLLVDDFQLVVELDHVLVRRLVGAVGMLSLVFLPPFRILVPVIEVVILSSPAVFPGAPQQCWRQISFIQVPSSRVSVQERGYELVSEVFGRTNVVIKTASIGGRLLVDNIILSSMAPIIRMAL